MNKLIALTGPKGCGKSFLARCAPLNQHSFADPIKFMLKSIGIPEENLWGKDKEEPIDWLAGRTARYMLQTLGTDWGRKIIDPDIWVKIQKVKVEDLISYGVPVIIDDCRFDNEALMVRDLGGIVIKINRPSVYRGNDAHLSERGVSPELIDCEFDNTDDSDFNKFLEEI